MKKLAVFIKNKMTFSGAATIAALVGGVTSATLPFTTPIATPLKL